MIKHNRLFSVTAIALLLVSCKQSEINKIVWSNWYDNGDGTHTRYDMNQISTIQTEDHKFVFEQYIVEPTELAPGEAEYVCSECGSHIIQHVPPTGNYVYDQEVVDDQYLYERRSEHTSIYYKSSVEGAYGDTNYLFEVSDIPQGYSEIDGISSNGVDAVETQFERDGKYEIIKNKIRSEDTLPSEYKEVDYLQTSAHQFFDTGVKARTNVRLVLDVEFLSLANNHSVLVTTREEINSYYLSIDGSKNSLHFSCFGHDFISSSPILTSRYLLDINNNGQIIVNDEILRESTEIPENFNDSTLNLFGTSDDMEACPTLRVYSCKIYVGEELVRDYIPAYTMGNRKAGLYDKVNNTFSISETEVSFKYGPEKFSSSLDNFKEDYVSSEEQTIEINDNYYQLDYLISNTGQYLATDLKPYRKRFVYDLQFMPNGYAQYMGVGSSYSEFFGITDSWKFVGNSENVAINERCTITDDVGIINERRTTTWINNSTNKYVGRGRDDDYWNQIMNRNMCFFNLTGYSYTYGRCFTNLRLYSIKVYDDRDILTNHFVPALSKINGEAGLLDIMSQKFYVSSTIPLNYGSIIEKSYNTNKISIFSRPWSQYVHPIKETIHEFEIFDKEEDKTERKYIPVLRNSDSKIGFLDIEHNEFLLADKDSFTGGKILGHILGEETVIKQPTYCEEGDTVRICSICGEEIHNHLSPTSYKVSFDLSEVSFDKVKIFNSNDPSDYKMDSICYTRNKNTFNYSKYDTWVSFEIDGNYKVETSGGVITKDGSLYTIEKIRNGTVVKITLLT